MVSIWRHDAQDPRHLIPREAGHMLGGVRGDFGLFEALTEAGRPTS